MAYLIALLSVVFAALSGCDALGEEIKPKPRFVMKEITTTLTSNPYVSELAASIDDAGYHATVNGTFTQPIGDNFMLKVDIQYNGAHLPVFEMEGCPSFYDKVFVEDVITKGFPKDSFPHQCPIPATSLSVANWEFPQYKLPPHTPPGPVNVDVDLYMPNEEPFLHVNCKGDVVIDGTDISVGPKVPGLG